MPVASSSRQSSASWKWCSVRTAPSKGCRLWARARRRPPRRAPRPRPPKPTPPAADAVGAALDPAAGAGRWAARRRRRRRRRRKARRRRGQRCRARRRGRAPGGGGGGVGDDGAASVAAGDAAASTVVDGTNGAAAAGVTVAGSAAEATGRDSTGRASRAPGAGAGGEARRRVAAQSGEVAAPHEAELSDEGALGRAQLAHGAVAPQRPSKARPAGRPPPGRRTAARSLRGCRPAARRRPRARAHVHLAAAAAAAPVARRARRRRRARRVGARLALRQNERDAAAGPARRAHAEAAHRHGRGHGRRRLPAPSRAPSSPAAPSPHGRRVRGACSPACAAPTPSRATRAVQRGHLGGRVGGRRLVDRPADCGPWPHEAPPSREAAAPRRLLLRQHGAPRPLRLRPRPPRATAHSGGSSTGRASPEESALHDRIRPAAIADVPLAARELSHLWERQDGAAVLRAPKTSGWWNTAPSAPTAHRHAPSSVSSIAIWCTRCAKRMRCSSGPPSRQR